jgi:hypothetical protein
MFDNPTALTAVTVANLIGIASGVMRKYASDQTSFLREENTNALVSAISLSNLIDRSSVFSLSSKFCNKSSIVTPYINTIIKQNTKSTIVHKALPCLLKFSSSEWILLILARNKPIIITSIASDTLGNILLSMQ